LYKIITSKQDSDVILKFNTIPVAFTRGNTYKRQDHVRYDLRKISLFRTRWNSLPDRTYCSRSWVWLFQNLSKLPLKLITES